MYYIYFIYSKSSEKYYLGYTNDPERRLIEHNTKDFNTYTKKHRPWELAHSLPVSDIRGDAVKIERFIKKQKSRNLIEKIINKKLGYNDFKGILSR